MTENTYWLALEAAKADLAEAHERRQRAVAEVKKADEETVALRRAVTALAALCGENVEDSMGLTQAVRTVASTTGWMSLKTFKEHIEQLGVSLSDLKNPDASVLSVLN